MTASSGVSNLRPQKDRVQSLTRLRRLVLLAALKVRAARVVLTADTDGREGASYAPRLASLIHLPYVRRFDVEGS